MFLYCFVILQRCICFLHHLQELGIRIILLSGKVKEPLIVVLGLFFILNQ